MDPNSGRAMNDESCDIRPRVSPDTIEWAFPLGDPQLVVAVPTTASGWTVSRLDQGFDIPDDPYAREFMRTLLRLAERALDMTEPARAEAGR